MSPTTFMHLPRELRDMIWSVAAPIQIAESLPKTPFAERMRQATVGYDNLPPDTELQPLRVYVHDTVKRDHMRLGVNEFWTLVNCLPMSTVCSEARSHAASFCHTQVKLMNLFYVVGEPRDVGEDILEPIFAQPLTVMVTKARYIDEPESFISAEQFASVISCVFGGVVERVILKPESDPNDTLERFYWPHTTQTRNLENIKPILIRSPSHDTKTVVMKPDRTARVDEEFYDENAMDIRQILWHLLKFYEFLDASAERLPQLQSIELELHMNCWDDVIVTRVKATNKNGVLWVNWNDCDVDYDLSFVRD